MQRPISSITKRLAGLRFGILLCHVVNRCLYIKPTEPLLAKHTSARHTPSTPNCAWIYSSEFIHRRRWGFEVCRRVLWVHHREQADREIEVVVEEVLEGFVLEQLRHVLLNDRKHDIPESGVLWIGRLVDELDGIYEFGLLAVFHRFEETLQLLGCEVLEYGDLILVGDRVDFDGEDHLTPARELVGVCGLIHVVDHRSEGLDVVLKLDLFGAVLALL